jgi:hypothetical protein
MTGPPILIEDVVAIRGGPLEPGKAMPPQKGLKGDGVEAFAGGDEKLEGRAALQNQQCQHLELPWRIGEGANGEFLVHIISREASEVGGIAPVHRRLLRDDLFVADGGVPPLEPDKQF